MKRAGFTLIEIIIVTFVIAILAAMVVPRAFTSIAKGKRARTIIELKALKTAVMSVYTDTSRFPNGCLAFGGANPKLTLNGPQAGLITVPPVGVVQGSCEWTASDINVWDGAYLDSIADVSDLWGTDYYLDPAYAMCQDAQISACDPDLRVAIECREACGGACGTITPQVLLSYGPDRTAETCDDLIVYLPWQ